MVDIRIEECKFRYCIAVVGTREHERKIDGVSAWLTRDDSVDYTKYDIVIDASREGEISFHARYELDIPGSDATVCIKETERMICIEQFVKLAIGPQLIGLDLMDCMDALSKCNKFATKVFDLGDIEEELVEFVNKCKIDPESDILAFIDGNILLKQISEFVDKISDIGNLQGDFYIGCNGIELKNSDKIRISMWYR